VGLEGDEELLERAFENLVRNAREAAGTGGHVVLQASRAGEEATLTVADDGPGLSADELGALRPFRTTKAGGLGLGLPLALKIVKLHGAATEPGPAGHGPPAGRRAGRGAGRRGNGPVPGMNVTEGIAGGVWRRVRRTCLFNPKVFNKHKFRGPMHRRNTDC
jgi:hypothetical protein